MDRYARVWAQTRAAYSGARPAVVGLRVGVFLRASGVVVLDGRREIARRPALRPQR